MSLTTIHVSAIGDFGTLQSLERLQSGDKFNELALPVRLNRDAAESVR